MATRRKELVWCIKKNLFKLVGNEAYQIARDITTDGEQACELEPTDEEGCVDYILKYIQSDTLLKSEDEGISQLLKLIDLLYSVIECREIVTATGGGAQARETFTSIPPTMTTDHATQSIAKPSTSVTGLMLGVTTPECNIQQHSHSSTDLNTQAVGQSHMMHNELSKSQHGRGISSSASGNHYHTAELASYPPPQQTPPHVASERVVSLRDLSYLQRREFKVHGGQIGDQSSDITYSSISKQIDEGLKEGITVTEVIRGVLRIIRPGTFKDMLIHKDEITISELKGFLRSHLGEKASTELFQELMCAKQNEQEPPQQFLYRMIGLKQRILFQSKQGNTDICYDPKTVQEVFLHTVYQGLGSKHTNIRQQLRPLLSDGDVTDEEILSQVGKIISDENEHHWATAPDRK